MNYHTTGLNTSALHDTLQNLASGQPDLIREHYGDPPPYSGETTRTPSPNLHEFHFSSQRLAELRESYNLTKPKNQFYLEVEEEDERLNGDYRKGRFNRDWYDKFFNSYPLAICIVRERWKKEGIWNVKWNSVEQTDIDNRWAVRDFLGDAGRNKSGGSRPGVFDRWRHEEIEPEGESGSESEQVMNSFSGLGNGRTRVNHQEAANARGVHCQCNRDVSRPSYRFRYGISKVREGLKKRSPFGDCSSEQARRIVKQIWQRRKIWDSIWGEEPDHLWRHEKPFATFVSREAENERGQESEPIQNIPTSPEGPSIHLLRQQEERESNFELLTTGEDREALYAAVGREPSPQPTFNPNLPADLFSKPFFIPPAKTPSTGCAIDKGFTGLDSSSQSFSAHQIPSKRAVRRRTRSPLRSLEPSGVTKTRSKNKIQQQSKVPEKVTPSRRTLRRAAQNAPPLAGLPPLSTALRRSARIVEQMRKESENLAAQTTKADAAVQRKRKKEAAFERNVKMTESTTRTDGNNQSKRSRKEKAPCRRRTSDTKGFGRRGKGKEITRKQNISRKQKIKVREMDR